MGGAESFDSMSEVEKEAARGGRGGAGGRGVRSQHVWGRERRKLLLKLHGRCRSRNTPSQTRVGSDRGCAWGQEIGKCWNT
jgi:hypothetical protein